MNMIDDTASILLRQADDRDAGAQHRGRRRQVAGDAQVGVALGQYHRAEPQRVAQLHGNFVVGGAGTAAAIFVGVTGQQRAALRVDDRTSPRMMSQVARQ